MNLGVLQASLKLNTSQFNSGIQKAIEGFNKIHNESVKLNQTFELLKNSFNVFAKAGQTAFEMVERGAKKADIESVFRNLSITAGKSADEMIAQMRKATSGYLDDIKAMSLATQSMIAGMNFDDVIIALSYLQKYSKATGKSFEQLTTTIMTGMARGSVLMLDDAGIIIDAQSLMQQKAEEYGRALTEVEKKQILVSEAIDQMTRKMGALGGETTSTYDAMQQLKTSWENFENWVGTFALKSVSFLMIALNGWRLLFDEIQKLGVKTKFVLENVFASLKLTITNSLTSLLQTVQKILFDLVANPNLPNKVKGFAKQALTGVNNLVADLTHSAGQTAGDLADKYYSTVDKKINEISDKQAEIIEGTQKWVDILTGKTKGSIGQFDLSPSVGVTTETTTTKKDALEYYNELADKESEIYNRMEELNNQIVRQQLYFQPDGEIKQKIFDITTHYETLINKYPELAEEYKKLQQAEIEYIQNTTLTDGMQNKLSAIQGMFSAFHDVFSSIGAQLGQALAESFEKGFDFGAFIANLGKMLRAMAIQKTVTLLFEAAYQQVMSQIYRTLAISNALANPALAEAYWQASIGAQVASSGALAGAAMMKSFATGLVAGELVGGMAHDGMKNIPEDGTWLLQKGERVVDSKTNKDLTDYLKNQKQSNINMTVNINGGDEQGVLKALPKLKQTIIEVVSGDIAQNGAIRKTILSYT